MPKIDWRDLAQVIALANRLGEGLAVIKHDSRSNYNIAHIDLAETMERYNNVKILHKT